MMTSAIQVEKQWSEYQRAIFANVNSGKGHTFVRARAGTGKTTTIVEALKHVPRGSSVILVAFNKPIAVELKSKAPKGVDVCTLHAFGLRAITNSLGRFLIPDDGKVIPKLKKMFPKKDDFELIQAVAKCVSLSKATLAHTTEEILDVIDAYGICDEPAEGEEEKEGAVTPVRVAREALGMLEWCKHPEEDGTIDFDDMVWLPVVRQLRLKKYDFMFVDEAQDLNPCQMAMISRVRGGRLICVGDDRQAIYAFRGADSQAVKTLVDRFEMQVLPLSITYRCGKSIVAEAQRFVPDYEAAEVAPEGIVRHTDVKRAREYAGQREGFCAGDFVLSRTNAALVSLALGLAADGRRVRIQGRDIGTSLKALAKKLAGRGTVAFSDKVIEWRLREIERLTLRGQDTQLVEDKANMLLALAGVCKTVPEVMKRIDDLFTDVKDENCITLSSTHKAKGLERERVFVLIDTYKPNRGIEEENLLYVAITRAKNELVYVAGEPEGTK